MQDSTLAFVKPRLAPHGPTNSSTNFLLHYSKTSHRNRSKENKPNISANIGHLCTKKPCFFGKHLQPAGSVISVSHTSKHFNHRFQKDTNFTSSTSDAPTTLCLGFIGSLYFVLSIIFFKCMTATKWRLRSWMIFSRISQVYKTLKLLTYSSLGHTQKHYSCDLTYPTEIKTEHAKEISQPEATTLVPFPAHQQQLN